MLVLLFFFLFTGQALAADDAWVWYKQARVLYQEGDQERALALLEAIPKRFPQAREVQLQAAVLAARIHYEQGEPDQVLALLKPWVTRADLPDEALFLLAAASAQKGLYEEALAYLRLFKKRFPHSPFDCEVNLVAAQVFSQRKLAPKAKRFAYRVLRNQKCNLKEKAQALSFLLRLGEEPQKFLSYLKNEEVRRYAPEVVKALIFYYLRQGKLAQAEEEVFKYLNLSGHEKEAPVLIFQLAEAYFKQKNYRSARRLFALLNTTWPYRKEASFARFRLLEMRYIFEKKIGQPQEQTRKLLLAACKRLKKEYPDDPLIEEVHALECTLLLEGKMIQEALESAWSFLARYPKSSYRSQVLQVVCRAASLWEQKLLAQKAFPEAILFFREHSQTLREARCGLAFYRAAEAYLALNLRGEALVTLLAGYDLKLSQAWAPDYLLTLVDLLLERGQKDDLSLARRLLRKIQRQYPSAAKSPYFAFLKGVLATKRGRYMEALRALASASKEAGDEALEKRAQEAYLKLLLRLGRYAEAFALAKKDPKAYQLELKDLARASIEEERWTLAQQVLSFLQEKFPEDPEVKWLLGTLYEKEGEGEKALAVWKELQGDQSLYGQFARDLLKAADLIEEARREVY